MNLLHTSLRFKQIYKKISIDDKANTSTYEQVVVKIETDFNLFNYVFEMFTKTNFN